MRRLPENIIKEFDLKKGGHVGMSFAMDLVIYQSGDLIISNYDFTISQPEKYDPDLSKKNMWLVFMKKRGYVKYFKISDELILDNLDILKEQISLMENEILSKVN